jgi:hypothetical protein
MMGRMGATVDTELLMCVMCPVVVVALFLYYVSNENFVYSFTRRVLLNHYNLIYGFLSDSVRIVGA